MEKMWKEFEEISKTKKNEPWDWDKEQKPLIQELYKKHVSTKWINWYDIWSDFDRWHNQCRNGVVCYHCGQMLIEEDYCPEWEEQQEMLERIIKRYERKMS